MLYISGKNETLKGLKEKEEFQGSLTDYMGKFNQLNSHLSIKFTDPTQSLLDWSPPT